MGEPSRGQTGLLVVVSRVHRSHWKPLSEQEPRLRGQRCLPLWKTERRQRGGCGETGPKPAAWVWVRNGRSGPGGWPWRWRDSGRGGPPGVEAGGPVAGGGSGGSLVKRRRGALGSQPAWRVSGGKEQRWASGTAPEACGAFSPEISLLRLQFGERIQKEGKTVRHQILRAVSCLLQ